jgi:hypothetical protein
MQDYANDEKRERLRKALKNLAHDGSFEVVLEWLKDELKDRDIENRVRGVENPTTEAHALAVIIEHAAACAVSTSGDGESQNEDTEKESAETTHMTA